MFQIVHRQHDYRSQVTEWIGYAGIVFMSPFAVNNLLQQRYLLAVTSFSIVLFSVFIVAQARRGEPTPRLNLVLYVLALTFLMVSIWQQGMIGLLWCFPAATIAYFMLSERQAWAMSVLLLALVVPSAFVIIDTPVAIRFSVTLALASLYAAIFLRVLSAQETQLQQAEERRLDAIAAVTHQLRTPLALLASRSEALAEEGQPLDRNQVAALSSSLNQVTAMLDDLHQIASSNDGALEFRMDTHNWAGIIADSASVAEKQLKGRGIRLVWDIEAAIPVLGDDTRLRQIVDNLLHNCVRHTISDGVVKLSAGVDGTEAILRVSDNGPGVPSEQLTVLFEPFVRPSSDGAADGVPSSIDEHGPVREFGGLGLALVQALVHRHRGHVHAEHAHDGGLVIEVRLPLVSN